MIVEWDCEFPSGTGKSKVDYWVNLKNGLQPLVLEVNSLVEGKQGNSPIYYTDSMDKVLKDVLKPMPLDTQLYCLLFMYPPPSKSRLEAIKESLSEHTRRNHVASTPTWKDPYY